MKEYRQEHKFRDRTGLGLLLIIVGVVLLVLNLDWIPFEIRSWLFSWKMLLIAIGLYIVMSKPNKESGLILMFIGGFFLARDHFFFLHDFRHFIFPALLIFAGIVFLLKTGRRTSIGSQNYYHKKESENN
jgi:predicted membrane protein